MAYGERETTIHYTTVMRVLRRNQVKASPNSEAKALCCLERDNKRRTPGTPFEIKLHG